MSNAAAIAERRAAADLTRAAYERTWRSDAKGSSERSAAWWHANWVVEQELRSHAHHVIAAGCEMVFWTYPEFAGAAQ